MPTTRTITDCTGVRITSEGEAETLDTWVDDWLVRHYDYAHGDAAVFVGNQLIYYLRLRRIECSSSSSYEVDVRNPTTGNILRYLRVRTSTSPADGRVIDTMEGT